MPETIATRPLTAGDLEAVIAIDETNVGRSRRGFFEKRLISAQENPRGYVYVGAERGGRFVGFAIARLHEGEFGETHPVAVLDALGVDASAQHAGIGHALLADLEGILAHKGIRELASEVDWTATGVAQFFIDMGFELAPRRVLEMTVDGAAGFGEV